LAVGINRQSSSIDRVRCAMPMVSCMTKDLTVSKARQRKGLYTMQSLPQQPSRRVAVVALAILLLALCGRVDSFGPPRPAVCSTRKGKPAGLLLAVPKATTGSSASDEEHVSRPGPVIPKWSKFRVPTKVVPYGLNVEIMNDKLQSQPRDGVVTSMVWAFGGQKYIHPELRSDFPVGQWLDKRANLGIALSGGGMRAASTCLGWYVSHHTLCNALCVAAFTDPSHLCNAWFACISR
jgi:hypothetical protein